MSTGVVLAIVIGSAAVCIAMSFGCCMSLICRNGSKKVSPAELSVRPASQPTQASIHLKRPQTAKDDTDCAKKLQSPTSGAAPAAAGTVVIRAPQHSPQPLIGGTVTSDIESPLATAALAFGEEPPQRRSLPQLVLECVDASPVAAEKRRSHSLFSLRSASSLSSLAGDSSPLNWSLPTIGSHLESDSSAEDFMEEDLEIADAKHAAFCADALWKARAAMRLSGRLNLDEGIDARSSSTVDCLPMNESPPLYLPSLSSSVHDTVPLAPFAVPSPPEPQGTATAHALELPPEPRLPAPPLRPQSAMGLRSLASMPTPLPPAPPSGLVPSNLPCQSGLPPEPLLPSAPW